MFAEGTAMTNYPARALVLLEIGEKATAPEHKAKALAIAQMWLSLADLEDVLAILAEEVKSETAMH